ncbi:MAG: RICIN domain-containing protein [Bacteroidales bacterium]|nr:RICIN domain-containing protein [Bacteroidales bacterium]
MKKTFLKFVFQSIIAIILSLNVNAQTANIYIGNNAQTIRGFGGMNFPRWIGDLTTAQVDKAFGNGYGQIGLSILRISVSPNSSDWSREIATAQRAKSHGAIVFATPWSPPASMKSNGSTTGGSLNTSSYSAYANHLRDFCNYMSNNGASLYAISVQNEPDWTPDYESCGWTASQMRTFLDNNASVIPAKVIAPETVNYKSDWMSTISGSSQVDILANHAYGGSPTLYSSSKEQWMTEHYAPNSNANSANNWPEALEAGKEIHNYMINGYSAYVWWYIRRSYCLIDENSNVTKRGFVMSHFSKFIRPGYVRVRSDAAPTSGVSVSSYQSGNTLVIVAINQNSSSKSITFNFSGNNVSNITKWETTGTSGHNVSEIGTYSGGTSFTNTLAGYSITTFRGTVGGSSGGDSDYYTISNRNSSKCVDVEGKSTSDNANIIQWSCNGGTNQQWSIEDAGNGYIYIKAVHSGKCMRAVNGNIVQYTCNTGWWSEMFSRVDAGSGYYLIKNRSTGTCLRVKDGSTSDGASIVLYDCNSNYWSEMFSFTSVKNASVNIDENLIIEKKNILSIYPNPVIKSLYVYLPENYRENISIAIYNSNGGQIFMESNIINAIDYKIDVSTLNPGIYIITVFNGSERMSQKFSKR